MTSSYSQSPRYAAEHGLRAFSAAGAALHGDERYGRNRPIAAMLVIPATAFVLGAAVGAVIAASVVRMVMR